MAKKINFKKTNFDELHLVLGYTKEELLKKKSRLFPVGKSDSETSATSIFLASLSAVKEYREALMSTVEVNKLSTKYSELHTYVEIEDKDNGCRPDGLIVITSGKNKPIIEWACFVESKVGSNNIDEFQIEKYIDFAKKIGIENIITISNQLATNPKQTPVEVNTRKKINLYHWSWTYLKTVALKLTNMNLVQDSDHEYILTELRRYFDTNKSISNYKNMGKEWKNSIKEIHNFQNKKKIPEELLTNIVNSYVQEEKDLSLQLTDCTDFYVELLTKDNRLVELKDMMNDLKIIKSNYILNNDKNTCFSVEVNFLSKIIKCYTNIIIKNGKAKSQTTTLLKMLDKNSVTENIKVKAIYNRKKTHQAVRLSELNNEKDMCKDYSILNKDLGNEVKCFEIMTEDEIGTSFQGPESFIVKLEENAKRFVEQVVAYKK